MIDLDELDGVPSSAPSADAVDLDDMVAAPGHAPRAHQAAAPQWTYTGRKPPIADSTELRRILALPTRPQLDTESPRARALVELVTGRYARQRTSACACAQIDPMRFADGRVGCLRRLNAAQAWALFEVGIVGGLAGAIGVGHGKTILDILTPLALADCAAAAADRAGAPFNREAYKVLLLVPPGLVDQLDREYQLLAQHFRVPSVTFYTRPIKRDVVGEPRLYVYPYSKLSRPDATVFMQGLRPHAVIADEAHMLGDLTSVRGGRVDKHFRALPDTACAWWTGSVTDSSIGDYAALARCALKDRSPVPRDDVEGGETLREWKSCLDPGKGEEDWAADPGALLDGLIETGMCRPGEHVYVGFHRRLVSTLGFVATTSAAVDVGLTITERDPDGVDDDEASDDRVPNTPREDERAPGIGAPPGQWPGIRDALELVRGGLRPDGEELIEPLSIARAARELASGFFYRWKFPRGEPESLIQRWRDARKAYRCELRELLAKRHDHLDSPYLCQLAAMRWYGEASADGGLIEVVDEDTGEIRRVDVGRLPAWHSLAWPEWRDVKDLVQPETEPVWIDEYLARDAAEWAREHRGVVWYDHHAFGLRVAQIGGLPLHGGGPDAGPRLVGGEYNGKRYKGEDGSRSIVCSIKSHGTGRDGLQRVFCEQLVANPLSSSDGWEQLLGRLHRIGQARDVTTWFYRHTVELDRHVRQALTRALYVESTIGANQKLRVGFRLAE